MATDKQERKVKHQETVKPGTKKLSALGKWFYDPDAQPLIKIIGMKAVLK